MIMKKMALVAAASLILTLGACNQEEEPPAAETPVDEVQAGTQTDDPASEEVPASAVAAEGAEVLFAEGEFLEQGYPHFVEVKVGEETRIFLATEEVHDILKTMEPSSQILFAYSETAEGQPIIISAEENPRASSSGETDAQANAWTYIGLMDSHSAEFEKNGESVVMQYNETLAESLNGLKEGSQVTVEYRTNEHGQFVLQKVESH